MGKIAWTDRSDWNPLRGCTRVSEGCRHCYAEAIAARFSGPGQPFEGFAEKTTNGPRWTGKIALMEDRLTLPLKWRKPAKIFVNSASDLFHENVPDEWIDRIFAVMALAPQHSFQVLTKRPKRMRAYFERWPDGAARFHHVAGEAYKIDPSLPHGANGWVWDLQKRWPLPNVWLGVTAEDQERADERIPELLATPAARRFVSVEPMLGPVDLTEIVIRHRVGEQHINALHCEEDPEDCGEIGPATLDWVIVGGESGPGSRPMHPQWARDLRDQCQAAGTAFFMKQMHVGGKLVKDVARFPEDLRVQEFPNAA
jgi:protein gp37